MQPQAALIRADGGIELHAIAAVDLHAPLIVHPADAEGDHALGLHDALGDVGLFQLRTAVEHALQRFQHLIDGLKVFLFVRVAAGSLFIYALQIQIMQFHGASPFINVENTETLRRETAEYESE